MKSQPLARCASILTTLTKLSEAEDWPALESNGWNVREILDSHRH